MAYKIFALPLIQYHIGKMPNENMARGQNIKISPEDKSRHYPLLFGSVGGWVVGFMTVRDENAEDL